MLILESAAVLAVMGGIFGGVLAVASKKFHVQTDERIALIVNVLPGANCGACGYPGCGGLAKSIVEGNADASACAVLKPADAKIIADIMGSDMQEKERLIARLRCSKPMVEAKKLYDYQGIDNCHLALNMFRGQRSCNYGCLGLGSCAQSCAFGAIAINSEGLPEINYSLCVGCGVCVNECPQFLLYLEKAHQKVIIACNNRDKGKQAKDVCPNACISCGLCVKFCPQQAITMITYKNSGTLPKLDSSKCIQCGICSEKCPSKLIKIMQAQSPIMPEHPKEEKTGCACCGGCVKN